MPEKKYIKLFKIAGLRNLTLSPEEQESVITTLDIILFDPIFLEVCDNAYMALKNSGCELPFFTSTSFLVLMNHSDRRASVIEVASQLIKSKTLFEKMSVKKAKSARAKLYVQYLMAAEKIYAPAGMEKLFQITLQDDIKRGEVCKVAAVYHWHRAIDTLYELSKLEPGVKFPPDEFKLVCESFDACFSYAEKTRLKYFIYEMKGHLASLSERTTIFEHIGVQPTKWNVSRKAADYFNSAHRKNPKISRYNRKIDFKMHSALCKEGRFYRIGSKTTGRATSR